MGGWVCRQVGGQIGGWVGGKEGQVGEQADGQTTFSFLEFSGSSSSSTGGGGGGSTDGVGSSSSVEAERYISDTEIAAHLKSGGGWVIIHGEVYDIHSIAANVPGTADKLMESIGKDATKAFEMAGHSDSTKEKMRQYIVGKYKEVGVVCTLVVQ